MGVYLSHLLMHVPVFVSTRSWFAPDIVILPAITDSPVLSGNLCLFDYWLLCYSVCGICAKFCWWRWWVRLIQRCTEIIYHHLYLWYVLGLGFCVTRWKRANWYGLLSVSNHLNAEMSHRGVRASAARITKCIGYRVGFWINTVSTFCCYVYFWILLVWLFSIYQWFIAVLGSHCNICYNLRHLQDMLIANWILCYFTLAYSECFNLLVHQEVLLYSNRKQSSVLRGPWEAAEGFTSFVQNMLLFATVRPLLLACSVSMLSVPV